jgi:hypothetical protein
LAVFVAVAPVVAGLAFVCAVALVVAGLAVFVAIAFVVEGLAVFVAVAPVVEGLAFGRDLLCLVMGRSPFIAPRVRLGASLRRHPTWRPAFSSHLDLPQISGRKIGKGLWYIAFRRNALHGR